MEALVLPEVIETSRLILRRLRYEDAEEIFYTYSSKEEATRYLSWRTHQKIEDTHDFLNYAIHGWERGSDFSFSIRLKASNQLVGSFGLLNDLGKIQFGYVFSPCHWGRGYATEVCQRMMTLLDTFPQIYRVSTFVDVENKSSVRVLEKSGLIREATLAKWFRFVNQDMQPKDCVLFYLPLTAR